MPLLPTLFWGDLCLYRLFCQILPFAWRALFGLSSCRIKAERWLLTRLSNTWNCQGNTKKKTQDHSPWWIFLSRALFISRGYLGFVGDKGTRIFFTSSSITKTVSNTIHFICKVIASHQISCTCADLQSIGVDGVLMDLTNSIEYADSQQFYIHCSRKWWSSYLRNMDLRERWRKQPWLTRSKLSVLISVNCASTFLTCWGLWWEAKSGQNWMQPQHVNWPAFAPCWGL